jgi:uncharacterized protein
MTDRTLGPGARTRVRRLPEKARYDAAVVFEVFDAAPFCHLAANVDGLAMALPTLHAREGDALYLHGSLANAVMRAAIAAGTASVTATIYEGLRLARSGFESSIAYRSVVAVGPVSLVEDEAERRRVLDLLVERVLPGRSHEVRPATEREVRLTLVVRVEIAEASVKVSAGPTDDSPEDQLLDVWSGTVPASMTWGTPVPSNDGAMASGDVPLPASVVRLLGDAP